MEQFKDWIKDMIEAALEEEVPPPAFIGFVSEAFRGAADMNRRSAEGLSRMQEIGQVWANEEQRNSSLKLYESRFADQFSDAQERIDRYQARFKKP